jgi:hypothetical protein
MKGDRFKAGQDDEVKPDREIMLSVSALETPKLYTTAL